MGKRKFRCRQSNFYPMNLSGKTNSIRSMSKLTDKLRTIFKGSISSACLIMFHNGISQPVQKVPVTEKDVYKLSTVPIPEGIHLEVGGMATLPGGSLALSTRRGEVWIVKNSQSNQPYYKRFASGLHEILGLAYQDGSLIMAQRGELTRLTDLNNDLKADRYESICSWPLSAHYHEFSYGPVMMPDNSMMITTNVAFGDNDWWFGESRVPWRGWTLQVSPDGTMAPFATGMRSTAGLKQIDGVFFYSENQGDWIGSGFIAHAEKGDFLGHPAGLKWADLPASPVKTREEDIYSQVDPRKSPSEGPFIMPKNLDERGSAFFEIKAPGVKVPAVWLPHGILGISTSDMLAIPQDDYFQGFKGQLLVGDQGQSRINRVFLEKVKGQYQGGAVAFRQGFQSGVLRLAWGTERTLYVGQTGRGWGTSGPDAYSLQRLTFPEKLPFEIERVRARPDGFEVVFTQPVDSSSIVNADSYQITGFIYKYHPVYGSPIIDQGECEIKGVKLIDGKTIRLAVSGLREKYIHEINLSGIRSRTGAPLLHDAAYYTLNKLPNGDNLKNYLTLGRSSQHTAHHDMAPRHHLSGNRPASKRNLEMPSDWTEGPSQTIVMGTKPGLNFDKNTLTIRAGSKVSLTLNNNDDMPHNFLLVNYGTADIVGAAALKLGLKGDELGYVPDSPHVLFHTGLVQPGGSETIYFAAPEKPGRYTYVCTYPGHYASMKGTLTVVP